MNDKILIIDDSKVFLSFITDLLNSSDLKSAKIRLINDSRTAIYAAEEFMPDLILTDLEMPHLNGHLICQEIKKHSLLSTTPIMMLTSSNSEDELLKAINFGADDYLYKGSSKDIVLIKIKSMLRYKNLVKESIRSKQLEAINALIATSNHEFNNALFISNGLIRKLKKQSTVDQLPLIEKIEDINERIEKVVKQLSKVNDVNYEDYADQVKMLKI
jgi:DNA-binding response OmpR family regulator